MFRYDLKSGYFHIDICPQQHTCLGFQWKERFYCYTVLAFGITTGPYMFTKCLRLDIEQLLPHFPANILQQGEDI
jgi:hypothetical protein